MLKAPVQPIVLRRLHLRCGDWTVRSLRVNRHLQPFDRYAPHRHAHGQLLLYLRGRGEQRVGHKKFPVGTFLTGFLLLGTAWIAWVHKEGSAAAWLLGAALSVSFVSAGISTIWLNLQLKKKQLS